MRKRILSALLAVMFLFTGLPGTAWAVGEGNMEAGGGQTETVTGDSFWNGLGYPLLRGRCGQSDGGFRNL